MELSDFRATFYAVVGFLLCLNVVVAYDYYIAYSKVVVASKPALKVAPVVKSRKALAKNKVSSKRRNEKNEQLIKGVAKHFAHKFKIDQHDVERIVTTVFKESRSKEEATTIFGLISQESGFNKNAFNMGSYGLMQVYYNVHRDKISADKLLEIEPNIRAGIKIYRDCKSSYKDFTRTMGCYNGSLEYPDKLSKYASGVLAYKKASAIF